MNTWYRLLILLPCTCAFLNCKSADSGNTGKLTETLTTQTPSDDTLSKDFYPDGQLKQVVLKKDSGDFKQLICTFYPNGIVKEKGHQGYYAGKEAATGMYVGTWYYYDTAGILTESVCYHNDEPAKAYIEKTRYYPGGAVRAVERYNNYELYESDVDSIGEWKYFDEHGKLLKTVKH